MTGRLPLRPHDEARPHVNLYELLRRLAGRLGDRPCIEWHEEVSTYASFLARVDAFASFLTAHGLGAHAERTELEPWELGQDVVALYLLNRPEYLEATFGAFGARVAPCNVNYRYVSHELAYLLEDAKPGAILYQGQFAPILAEVLPHLQRRPLLLQVSDETDHPLLPGAIDFEEALAGHLARRQGPPPTEPSPDDVYVLYTGGTTGMPKGTLWSQADLWLGALDGDQHGTTLTIDDLADEIAAVGGPRMLPAAPFMHGAGHWAALRTILGGGTVVVGRVNDRFDPEDVWSTIAARRVDRVLIVGEAMARPLLNVLRAGNHDVTTLEHMIVGGAPTSMETKEALIAALPNVSISDTAGASETGRALSKRSISGDLGTPGVFVPNEYVAAIDDTRTRFLEPEEQEVGWLAKWGPIPFGYLGDEAKTRHTFLVVEGRRVVVPGDRVRYRPDGSIELLGRDSVTINTGGEKVFVEEVEQAILCHPSVEDAIVTGRASERWGEEVVAVVQVNRDCTDASIIDVAAQKLARFKLPKELIRVPQVVRSPAGKPDYRWALSIVDQMKTMKHGDRNL